MTPRFPGARLPWILLAAMTVVTLGGPIIIILSLRGGAHPRWPPDRPVEWVALVGVSALVLGLMVLAVAAAVANQRAAARLRGVRRPPEEVDRPGGPPSPSA